jgi:Lon protease-like protein
MKRNQDRILLVLSMVCLWLPAGTARAQSLSPDTPSPSIKLPQTIPIFPLPESMLFPNVPRGLIIFEPRYRTMLADALNGDRLIGMVTLRPGWESDYEGRPPIYEIGCAGIIADVQQWPDGRSAILLRGLVKFRVTSEDQSRVYRMARVETIPELLTDEDRIALREQRQRLEALLPSIAPGSDPPPRTLPDDEVVNALAQVLDLDPFDRQRLLERDGARSRAELLLNILQGK